MINFLSQYIHYKFFACIAVKHREIKQANAEYSVPIKNNMLFIPCFCLSCVFTSSRLYNIPEVPMPNIYTCSIV